MARRKKYPRLPNSFGSIRYISKGRRNPYAVHPPCKETDEFGRPIRPKALCYVDDWYVGFAVLTAYHAGTYKPGDELELRTYRQQSEGRDLDVFCQRLLDDFSAHRSSNLIQMKKKKTFAEVFAEFFNWKFGEGSGRILSASTLQGSKSAFKNCAPLHDKAFVDLRYNDLQGCIDACPLKRASKEMMVSLIKQMYKYADMVELIEKDYSAHISPNVPEDDEHGVAFTDEELNILWKNKENPTVGMILIMCYSGFRISAFHKIEINLEGMYFRGGVKTKASKERIVPIHSAIVDLVKSRRAVRPDDFIGKTEANFRNEMYAVLKKLEIPKHTPHDCRHTFSRLCEKYEVNENDRKRLLGHAFQDITNAVYGHRSIEELRKAIEMIKVADVV